MNNDLKMTSAWVNDQWKMSFDSDPSKQAQEVIFSRKNKKIDHFLLVFNNTYIPQATSEKRVGIVLNNRLTSEKHLKGEVNKTNKTIGLLYKLQNILPRAALTITYKAFVRPHLDYGDILYDKVCNNTLCNLFIYYQDSG